ncbi:alpha/beta hydrolase [Citricoccus sp. NPDC079358]|uniref:alpha/beta hydrolase n=1 Tax=Citricoccus sp. NPDC079358 TaxID=3154653 RepID=UPI00344E7650
MEPLTVDLSATDHVPAGEPIRTAAQTVVTRTETVQTTVGDLQQSWTAVPGLYSDTPHDDQLYTAFQDPDADVDAVVSMAAGLQSAAEAAADAFDDIRRARSRIRDVDLPAAQTRYETACEGQDPSTWWSFRELYERPLQADADGLATDLSTAESDFSAAVATAMALRPGRSVKANFDYGTHDPSVVEALDLHTKATGPHASAEDLTAYYEHLATLTPEQIETLGALDPAARTTPPPLPETEEDVAAWPGGAEGSAWWQGLTQQQQYALVLALPALVGNTEGVPFTDRAAAHTRVLDLTQHDPDLTEAQQEDLDGLREAVENAPAGTDGERYLISLRVNEEPVLGAVSIGNPDTADTVTWRVPGMGAETSGAASMTSEMQSIYDATTGDRAVVLWIGYDTPDGAQNPETLGSSQVLSNESAYEGSIGLAHALDGFQESRQANADYVAGFPGVDGTPSAAPRFNVAAHSYGTPTAAYALTMTEHTVDTYVMYGSVGVDPDRVPDATALNVALDADGHPEVYATQARGDHIAVPLGQTLSPFGGQQRISPTDDAFGAKAFSSDGDGTSPGAATTDHMGQLGEIGPEGGYGYTEAGSQSLNSIAAILDGNGDDVPQVDQSWWDDLREDPTATLQAEVRAPVDSWQQQANTTADAAQEERNSTIDEMQENSSFLTPLDHATIDVIQWGSNGLQDGAQAIRDYGVDQAQNVGDWAVEQGVEKVQESWPWLMEKGPGLYAALEEGGLPTYIDTTVDGLQDELRDDVDDRQTAANATVDLSQHAGQLAVDDFQDRHGWVPDAPVDVAQYAADVAVDWSQEKADDMVDGLQDVGDTVINGGQGWLRDKLFS